MRVRTTFERDEYMRWLSQRRSITNAMRDPKPDPPRCPRCGCYQFVYKGDKQVCADCRRE